MSQVVMSSKTILSALVILSVFQSVLARDISPEEVVITPKIDNYSISSLCNTPQQALSRGDYMCKKQYIITLTSNQGIFENYRFSGGSASVETSHHNIYTLSKAQNKSEYKIYLDEIEFEKLLKSKRAKVIFQNTLFSLNYLNQEFNYALESVEREDCSGGYDDRLCRLINARSYPRERVYYRSLDEFPAEISITLGLDYYHLKSLQSRCSTEIKQCKRELGSINSPAERLKRFFR